MIDEKVEKLKASRIGKKFSSRFDKNQLISKKWINYQLLPFENLNSLFDDTIGLNYFIDNVYLNSGKNVLFILRKNINSKEGTIYAILNNGNELSLKKLTELSKNVFFDNYLKLSKIKIKRDKIIVTSEDVYGEVNKYSIE